jgi:hypothetical protein
MGVGGVNLRIGGRFTLSNPKKMRLNRQDAKTPRVENTPRVNIKLKKRSAEFAQFSEVFSVFFPTLAFWRLGGSFAFSTVDCLDWV